MSVVEVRTVDHVIHPVCSPICASTGYDRDDFPVICQESVQPADILVIAGPIWLGDQSAQAR